MHIVNAISRREIYLRETGRYHQLIAEGFTRFGVHEGGRGKFTQMAELTALCAECPEREDVIDPVPAPKKSNSVNPKLEQLRKLRVRGYTTTQIALTLGMPASTVRGTLRKMGLATRSYVSKSLTR